MQASITAQQGGFELLKSQHEQEHAMMLQQQHILQAQLAAAVAEADTGASEAQQERIALLSAAEVRI